jgi:hypothetical protein
MHDDAALKSSILARHEATLGAFRENQEARNESVSLIRQRARAIQVYFSNAK